MRSSEIAKRPVVTLDGEDVAQIKDIVFEPGGGTVAGFTLANRGLFAGPKKKSLPWSGVHGMGRDAVVVASEDAFVGLGALEQDGGAGGGDVLGSRVLTDTGTELGKVVDVILEVGAQFDVVGYEIDPKDGKKVFLPLPDTMAVGRESLVVPQSATEFVKDDLAGFGAAVEDFRLRLAGHS